MKASISRCIHRLYVTTLLSMIVAGAAHAVPTANDPVAAELFGRKIHCSQLIPYVDDSPDNLGAPNSAKAKKVIKERAEDLESNIFRALLDKFEKDVSIKVTDQDLAAIHQALSKDDNPPTDLSPKDLREVHASLVRTWKLSKALYEKYGGTVIFQQGNPLEPVGAYRKLIEEGEAKGYYKVLDPRLKPFMWGYFTREDHPFQIPKAEIDFSTPWWMKSNDSAEDSGAKSQ